MRYKYVFMDLDGTITEPVVGITNAYMYALSKFGIEVKDRAELHQVIGPPLRQSFSKYYGFSDEDTEKAVKYYREYYSGRGLEENDIMPGISEALETLKNTGCKVYVATSKPEEYAVRILQNVGLDGYFDYIAGASMDSSRDNKIAVMQYLLEHIAEVEGDVDISDIVMVGDRWHDIDGANHFNMDSIGVTFGYGDRKELTDYGATYIVDSTEEMVDIILAV